MAFSSWLSPLAIVCLPALLVAACDRPGTPSPQASDALPDEVTAPAAPRASTGSVDRTRAGEAAPPAAFQRPDGSATTLAEFRGRPVLVNLWATWCAPCIAELPTLNALAGSGGVRVVAVSQDLDPAKPAPFLAARKLTRLAPYRDPQMGLSVGLGANLPTTILYDAAGREVWRVTGERDWASAESRALVTEVSRPAAP